MTDNPALTDRWRQSLRLRGDRLRSAVGLGPAAARRSQAPDDARFFWAASQADDVAAAVRRSLPDAIERSLREADQALSADGSTRLRESAGALVRSWFYTHDNQYLWGLADLWRSAHRPREESAWLHKPRDRDLRLATWLARLLEGALDTALFESDAGRLARALFARTLVDPPSDVVERLSRGQALCLAGTALTMFEESGRWRELGRRLIRDTLRDRLLEDGTLEGCKLADHARALELLLEHFQLQDDAQRAALEADVNSIAEFLARLLQAGWTHPLLRDATSEAGIAHHQPGGLDLLATAATLLGRGDFKSIISKPSEASFWLAGANAGALFDALVAHPRPRAGHRHISGWHVSAHPAGGGCLLAGVEASLEPGGLGLLWQRGESDWVYEPGYQQPGDTLLWSCGETLAFVRGRNRAVERSVAHFAAGRLLVLDRFRRPEDVPRQRWRVAGDLQRVGVHAGGISFEGSRGPVLALLAASSREWLNEISDVGPAPVAPGPRIFEAAGCAEPGSGVERAVLLLPGDAARSPGILTRVTQGVEGDAGVYIWRRNSTLEVFLFGAGPPWKALGWAGAARFVWWRADSSGLVEELIAVPGVELRAGAFRLPVAGERIRWLRDRAENAPRLDLRGGA